MLSPIIPAIGNIVYFYDKRQQSIVSYTVAATNANGVIAVYNHHDPLIVNSYNQGYPVSIVINVNQIVKIY